jgi:hypothetical protein
VTRGSVNAFSVDTHELEIIVLPSFPVVPTPVVKCFAAGFTARLLIYPCGLELFAALPTFHASHIQRLTRVSERPHTGLKIHEILWARMVVPKFVPFYLWYGKLNPLVHIELARHDSFFWCHAFDVDPYMFRIYISQVPE